MCRVEDADPWDFFYEENRKAAKQHRCTECHRAIRDGELYHIFTGKFDGHWVTHRMCEHCDAMSEWLVAVCGGYLFTELLDELIEHWQEGFVSMPFGRLVVAMKRKWDDGAYPVPARQSVRDIAEEMCVAMEARIRA